MSTKMSRNMNRRAWLGGAALLTTALATRPTRAQGRPLRCGVGPLLPSANDTVKAYTPIFAYLAHELGTPYELVATTDWAGMAVAMGAGQLDIAWMGPWGYVLAHAASRCRAVATAKYDDKPIYHAIIIARTDLSVTNFPADTAGRSMSFADLGSTSGWLIPTYYCKEIWKIDPKRFWSYSEGATHAANEIAVGSGLSDLATDFDRNRNAMIESGRVQSDASRIVWTSAALPNDAIALPADASADLAAQVRDILTRLSAEQAATLLPKHYTGFVAATHADYATIEKAGIAVGKIKPGA